MNDTNEINIEIIEECVAGKGKHPVTSHLEDRHQSLCDLSPSEFTVSLPIMHSYELSGSVVHNMAVALLRG